jgi:8-oxo-dGTP pyrophosphatase MutT (NUDIX family)
MIQRKDSLSFMEFIRGKYKTDQIQYILQLLGCMAANEREMLVTLPFEKLWNIIWFQPSLPRQTTEYHEAKRKFDALRGGICIGNKIVTLYDLLNLAPSPYTEPEWGFPKGRRRLREEDIDCAVREFCEETAFDPLDIKVETTFPPFEEIFFGTNNVLYRHVYYVARLQGDQTRNPVVDPRNINQAREVRAVSWFEFDNTLQHIRDHNQERKELFKQAHQKILSYLKN